MKLQNNLFGNMNQKIVWIIILFLISKPFINKEVLIDFFWKRSEYDSLENYLKLCSKGKIMINIFHLFIIKSYIYQDL